MTLRPATSADLDRVCDLFLQVIGQQVYFPYDPTTTREQVEESWVNLGNIVYVAEEEGRILGAYIVKPNQPGHGSHVANAAYMVDAAARNRGIGRRLGAHSLETARAAGYRAMQYNLVVSTNESAVHLWRELGFAVIGTVPEGFRHMELGYVDAYIMYREL